MDRFYASESIWGRCLAYKRVAKLCLFVCISVSAFCMEAVSAAEIILRPTVTTAAGETIIVLGDKPELSSWNKAAGLPCTKAATTSEWTCQAFTLAAGTSYQYKYAKRNSSGVVTYETISNRTRVAPTVTTQYLEVWNVSGGTPVIPPSSSQSSSVAVASSSKSSVASSTQSSSIAVASSSKSSVVSSIQSSSVAVASSSKSSVASSTQSSSIAVVSSSKSSVASSIQSSSAAVVSSSKSSVALSSSSVPAAIQIILQPTVTTAAGETVIVLGDKPELSSWNKAAGLPCTKAATTSEWTCQAFTLAAGTSYQYKYAKRNSSGVVTYESISNRTRVAPTVTTLYLEAWNVSGGTPVIPSSSSRSSSSATASSVASSSKSSSIAASSNVASSSKLSSVASSIQSSSAAPIAPAAPASITPSLNGTSVNLGWSASVNATSYEVQRNSAALTTTASGVVIFSDTNVPTGAVHTYRVRACNGAACSGWTTAAPMTIAPLAPASMMASLSGKSVNLNWGATTGATSYEVQKNAAPLTNTAAGVVAFVDNNVASGAVYNYRVRACLGTACSAWTNATALTVAPAVPGSVTVGLNGTSLSVSWGASAGATSYKIQKNSVDLTTATALSLNDSAVVVGTPYTYSVVACLGSVCSAAKQSAAFVVPPAVPATISAAISGTSINVTWSASTGATKYELQRNSDTPLAKTTISHTDASIAFGNLYTYSVRACASTACSSWRSTEITPTPAAPASISVPVLGSSFVVVTWPASAGATSYKIVRNGQESFIGNSTTLSDYDVQPATTYTYGVSACAENVCSSWTYAAPKTTDAPSPPSIPPEPEPTIDGPFAPGPLTLVNSGSGVVKISWPVVSNAHWYEISRTGISHNGWTPVGVTDRSSEISGKYQTTFTDTKAPAGLQVYGVIACSQAINSGPRCSNLREATIEVQPVGVENNSVAVTTLLGDSSVPSAVAATLNQPSKLGIPSSGLKLMVSGDSSTEMLIMNQPNASGISYNKISTFEANKPIKIINTANTFGGAAAKLFIIQADSIGLHNSIEVVGETADILIYGGGTKFSCLTCSFANFGRVTLASANTNVGPFSATVGKLSPTGFDLIVNNLSAPGIASLELIGAVKNYGEINTNLRANFSPLGGYDIAKDGGLSVGSGGVNIYQGRSVVDYETLNIVQQYQSASLCSVRGKIHSASIRIHAAAPLVINGDLSTQSDILANTIYRGKLHSAAEGIEISNLPAVYKDSSGKISKNEVGTLYLNGSLKSDFNVALNVSGTLYVSGEVNAKKLEVAAIGHIRNKSSGAIKSSEVTMVSDRFENNGRISGDAVKIVADNDIQNRFGGKILGDTIILASNKSIVRNGSQYPFVPSVEIDPYMYSSSVSALSSNTFNVTKLGTIGSLSFAGARKVDDLSARIVGRNIHIDAASNVENINPYYSATLNSADWVNGVPFNDAITDRVIIIGEESLKIQAGSYVVNSSAIMGVNAYSKDQKFVISSPRISNERYYTRVLADVVTENNTIVTNSGSTSSTTNNLQANLYVYSPPGIIYSFAALNFNFPVISASSGFVNNTAYFEALSDVYFTGVGKVTSIGLALEKENFSSVTSTIQQVQECWVYDGSRMINTGACTKLITTSGTSSGTTVKTDMERTLFSVAGTTSGIENGSSVSLHTADHQTLDDIQANIIKSYTSKMEAATTTVGQWKSVVTSTLSSDGKTITNTTNYVPVNPQVTPTTAKPASTTTIAQVWNILVEAIVKLKNDFMTELNNLIAWLEK